MAEDPDLFCFFGSLSNVGVRGEREKDSGTEGEETAEAEGDSFEGLDGVVAAFRESVGQRYIESVEYVRAPVSEHPAAGIELMELESVAGVEESFESLPGRIFVGGVHEGEEGHLERVGLGELIGEA